MRGVSWLPRLFVLVLLVLLPFVFGQLFTAALIKLKLDPSTALLVVIGIFLGSPINIPVKRISREESVVARPADGVRTSGVVAKPSTSPQRNDHRRQGETMNRRACALQR